MNTQGLSIEGFNTRAEYAAENLVNNSIFNGETAYELAAQFEKAIDAGNPETLMVLAGLVIKLRSLPKPDPDEVVSAIIGPGAKAK